MDRQSPQASSSRISPSSFLRALALLAVPLLLHGAPAAGASRPCGTALTDAPPRPGEQFGCSVFLQGNTLAVGANLDAVGAAAGGSVTPFERGDSGWIRQAKLAPADLPDGAQFGFATAISGDLLAVGAPFADSGAARGSGAVYVFRRNGNGWSQEAKLAPAQAATGDRFGLVVAASGDALAVGAPFSTTTAGSLAGAVYVFRRTAGSWGQEAQLVAADAAPFANFGYSVALDGGTLLAGAPFAGGGSNAGPGAGAAYVFQGSGGSWTQQAKLTAPQAAGGDELGASVAVVGGSAVVGARRGAAGGFASAGAAYAFDGSSGSWTLIDRLEAPDPTAGALFGVSLSMSGTRVLVGARGDSEAANGAGAAYLFARAASGHWLLVEKRTPAGATAGAVFGQSVALSGNDIVIGGPFDAAGGADRTGLITLCQVPQPNLAITLSDGVTTVLPGQTVVYTLAVSNSGDAAVTGATVTDLFPPQLKNVRWCPPAAGPGCQQPRSGNIQDTLDLAAGAQAVYTATAQVDPSASGLVTDRACLAAPAFGVDAGTLCATDTDTILAADLALAESAPASVHMGTVLSAVLQVTNLGPAPATGVRLVDPVPPGLVPLAASDPRCTAGPGQFSCALGTLAPGASVALQLNFQVPICYQSPNPIVNTASVAANEADLNRGNNSATAQTALLAGRRASRPGVTCPADLAVTVSPPVFGQAALTELYTVSVKNLGTAAVAGAQVSGMFRPNLKRVLWCRDAAACLPGAPCACPAAGSCAPSIPGPFMDVQNIPAGGTACWEVLVSVPQPFFPVFPKADFLCFTATAKLPGTEVDPTPADDAASKLACLFTGNAQCCPMKPPAGFCPGATLRGPFCGP
jgi:uncharacterized repeat protein (TIGR01451 family)